MFSSRFLISDSPLRLPPPPPPSSLSISLSPTPAACPVLCSGNGQYDKGSCVCYSGWKGPECDVPVTQCIDPLCSGHGTCTDGNCICSIGYKGLSCAEGELPSPRWCAVPGGCGIISFSFFFFFIALSPTHIPLVAQTLCV